MRVGPYAIILGPLAVLIACAPVQRRQADEFALRAADEQHRRADVAGDVAAMAEITHPRLTLNAPNNQIVSREELLSLMRSGQLGTQSLERFAEAVVIHGDAGIVMGRETVVPAPASISGRMYGGVPQNRRYTHIYVREAGSWKLIGRHANVIPQAR